MSKIKILLVEDEADVAEGIQAILEDQGYFVPDVPVAMVTAVWDKDEAKKTFEMGAYEYVTKPIDMEYLKRTVLTKFLPDE